MPPPIEAGPKRLAAQGLQIGRLERHVLVRVMCEGGAVADVALTLDEAASVACAILQERERVRREGATGPSKRLYLPSLQ